MDKDQKPTFFKYNTHVQNPVGQEIIYLNSIISLVFNGEVLCFLRGKDWILKYYLQQPHPLPVANLVKTVRSFVSEINHVDRGTDTVSLCPRFTHVKYSKTHALC
jgi:hypothetical protein